MKKVLLLALLAPLFTFGQSTPLTFSYSIGLSQAYYSLPQSSLEYETGISDGLSTGLNLSTSFKLLKFLSLHTEIGLISCSNKILEIEINGDSPGNNGEYFNLEHDLSMAYFFIAPEFRPFRQRNFFIRGFPTLNISLQDEYRSQTIGGGWMIVQQSSSQETISFNELERNTKHRWLFIFDLGYDSPEFGDGMSIRLACRVHIIPASKINYPEYFETFPTALPNIGMNSLNYMIGLSKRL